ncbi:MAG: HD domain-containing protein [Kiritimatiellae bacterium]|nr:HD domain-containing protein [Kiritimatiellia bacterium]
MRLEQQIKFIVEIDKLKNVYRQTLLMNGQRKENDAEHSWHLSTMAILLAEYAAEPGLDLMRVIKMLLIHDIVEIDAGDTFCYDEKGAMDKEERETRAAERIFAILPSDQSKEIRSLWNEFESRLTPESCFAAGLDRLQPLLHNYNTGGAAWQEHGVTSSQVFARNRHMADGSPMLWAFAENMIRDAVKKGYLSE